jgi:hypothetical protein
MGNAACQAVFEEKQVAFNKKVDRCMLVTLARHH